MSFKLAFKNIKKSIKDYAIYFFTLILGVAIFYIFNAIESQTVMLNVSQSTHELIDLMNQILAGVSVFVAFILAFLIIYANRFLMKRRHKEFGIYLTLGMGKRDISKTLLTETLLIGIISLIVGLLAGVGLSQIMSVIVANMFEADMTEFAFVLSTSAIIKTLIFFSIIYLVVMIFNTIQISKCKLIDLIHANKKSEQVKMKNPIICLIVFILASCLLGYAYYNVTVGIEHLSEFSDIIIQMIYGAIGTFLVFWSLSGLILKLVQHNKKLYYHNLNTFTLRQLSSKINTTVVSMTIICLMLFLTICIFSSAVSLKNSLSANLVNYTPVDINLYTTIVDNTENAIETALNNANFKWNNLKDMLSINTYNSNLTFKDTLGTESNAIQQKYPFMNMNMKEEIIKVSDYNKIAKLYGLKEYEVTGNEYIIICNYDNIKIIRNQALKVNTKITINNKDYYPKYKEAQPGYIMISNSATNSGIFIVPDDTPLTTNDLNTNYLIANYNAIDKQGKQKINNYLISDTFTDDIKNNNPVYNNIEGVTKIQIYETSIGLTSMATFIGVYLGIVFLISSAAILSLKELSESTDNKEQYKMLEKIGADKKMINKTLFAQVAIFFIFPLLVAIVHSIFGIQTCNFILQTFGNQRILASIITTAAFLLLIYGGYFIITYFSSKRIIK